MPPICAESRNARMRGSSVPPLTAAAGFMAGCRLGAGTVGFVATGGVVVAGVGTEVATLGVADDGGGVVAAGGGAPIGGTLMRMSSGAGAGTAGAGALAVVAGVLEAGSGFDALDTGAGALAAGGATVAGAVVVGAVLATVGLAGDIPVPADDGRMIHHTAPPPMTSATAIPANNPIPGPPRLGAGR